MKKIIVFINLCLSLITYSQEEIKMREAFKLSIPVDSEHNYGMEVKESPYFVKENILQIYPGEKIFIESEISNDTLVSMKVVKHIKYPEKTIELEFSIDSSNRNNLSSMLIIKNPFDKKLSYKAMMYTPISQTWKDTSTIPISPKLTNFETWPHSIITLVLTDWLLK